MKRLLLPLLAALALPTAVNAKEFYLIIKSVTGTLNTTPSQAGWVVPMKTMDGCEEAGQKLISSERFSGPVSFECLESK